jgi:hypothetical protein
VAGDLGADAGRVEGERIGPDGAEERADIGAEEIVQKDAVGAGIREGQVCLAVAGEVGEELNGVADIDDDGRPAFFPGERASILFGLMSGLDHGGVPAVGLAEADAAERGAEVLVAGIQACKTPG